VRQLKELLNNNTELKAQLAALLAKQQQQQQASA
jgi:hypothetical protein